MSRYEIPHESLRIVVGWISMLETFFVRVTRPAAEAGQEDSLLYAVGTQPKALLSVESVRHHLRPFTPLPPDIAAALQHDLEGRTPPARPRPAPRFFQGS